MKNQLIAIPTNHLINNPDKPGYCRIKRDTKIPQGRNWQNNPYTWEQVLGFIARSGTGIILGRHYAALDIDNEIARNTFTEHFGVSPYEFNAISWYSGKTFDGGYDEQITDQSNITVLFALTLEQSESLGKRLVGYKNSFDIRTGKSQCVLPSESLHPDTGKPYQWHKSPLEASLGEIPNLDLLISKIIAYKLEHDPSSVYSAEARSEALERNQKTQDDYQAYTRGEKPDFKHTPTSYMRFVIEPYFQDYPELLYDGAGWGNHGLLSQYQAESREHLTRLAGDPLWRESSSKSSLVVFASINPITNTKIWSWRDHGSEYGGNVLAYRYHMINQLNNLTPELPYPDSATGWEICNYYRRKLGALPDPVNLELPEYAGKKGIHIHPEGKNPEVYLNSTIEDKTDETGRNWINYEWDDAYQAGINPSELRDLAGYASLDNETLKVKVSDHTDVKQVYRLLRLAGIKTIIDRRGTGSGKSHLAGSLSPDDFNFHPAELEQIEHNNELASIGYLHYIHPLNHRNPPTSTLMNWAQEPVRKGGEVLTHDGRKERYKDPVTHPDQHQVEEANCLRYAAFELAYRFNLDLQTTNEKGNKVNLICSQCPVQEQCVKGEGKYTYRYQKYQAQFNRKTRIHPDSLGSPDIQDGQRKGFRFENAVGVFDEIDAHELQKTYRFTAAQLRNAWGKVLAQLERYNMIRATLNQQSRCMPVALVNWINTLIANLERSGNHEFDVLPVNRYGLAPNHEFFTESLGLMNDELEFLDALFDELAFTMVDYDLEFFNQKLDIENAVDYTYDDAGNVISAELNKSQNHQNITTFQDVGEAKILIEMLKSRCGFKRGVMNIEKSKKADNPELSHDNQETLTNLTNNANYEAVFTMPNTRYITAFKAYDTAIVQDATVDPIILIDTLDLDRAKTVEIVKSEPIPQNLTVTQIVGLGRLGMDRGDDIQRRADALKTQLINHLAQTISPDKIGIFDFKKYQSASDFVNGVWGRDNRGSNEFQDCVYLIMFGVLTPNFNAILREFTCIYGNVPTHETEWVHRQVNARNYKELVTSCNKESSDTKFREFVYRKIQNETNQCLGRLRANRRGDSELHIIMVTDYPSQWDVELKFIGEISPELLDKKSRNYHVIFQAIQDWVVSPETPITAKLIAENTGLSKAMVSRALNEFYNGQCEQFLLTEYAGITSKITDYNLIRVSNNTPESMLERVQYTQDLIQSESEKSKKTMKITEFNTSGLYPSSEPDCYELGTVSPEDARNIVWASPITEQKKRDIGKVDYLNINEKLLDLFQSANYTLPEYHPTEIPPYSALNLIYCDIETVPLPDYLTEPKAALDPDKARITHIGMKGSGSWSEILTHQDERAILTQFITNLKTRALNLDCLVFHNGHNFDIPFIAKRCEIHGIDHPFTQDDKATTVNATSVFGKPITLNQWRFNSYFQGVNFHASVIDTYILLAIEDNVKRKLESLSLKVGALSHGRATERLELRADQIQEYWYSQNPALQQLITDYLQYDLEDTELINRDLLPAFYYQLAFVPDANLQDVIVQGTGAKWNKILTYEIGREKFGDDVNQYFRNRPKSTQTTGYEGGKTWGKAGIHLNVGKLDVASMYPSVMLKYGIKPSKDEGYKTLAILKYLFDERIRNKRIASGRMTKPDGTAYTDHEIAEADYMQSAMKVLINSAYGFMGVITNFNDPVAAAIVTAYARALLDLMIAKTEEYGGEIIEVDTDGVIFKLPILDDPVDNHRQFVNLCNAVKAEMPDGIEIDDLEFHASGIYVPHNPNEKNPEINGSGQRKNYMVFFDQNVDRPKKPIIKGQFRKRDRCKLENEFTAKYVELYITDSPEIAESYYNETMNAISSDVIDRELLRITKTVPKTDKKFKRLNLRPGDKFSGWIAANGMETMNIADGYSVWHYQQIIKDRHDQIIKACAFETRSQQLSLFS